MRTHRSEKKLLKRTAKLQKELAAKNHELQIEAALENVRAVAMAINKPDDLPGVCKTMYKQFLSLGFSEIRNAMINIHKEFKARKFDSRMTMQVHDELVFDVHKNEVEQVKPIIIENMKNAIKTAVPIVVEVGVGSNWLEAH